MNQTLNKKYHDEVPLDDYEKELQEFLNKGEFVRAKNYKKNNKIFEEAAKRYIELQKSKRITLRVKQKDLIRLKAKAIKKNIPYQRLIGALINQYAEGNTRITI